MPVTAATASRQDVPDMFDAIGIWHNVVTVPASAVLAGPNGD
jgi:hypothetical protein